MDGMMPDITVLLILAVGALGWIVFNVRNLDR